MAKLNSDVKIENNKVILSNEILDILESWKINEEIAKFVERYKEILLNPSNINTPKFRIHHIIPCFLFKSKTRLTRKETEPLANAIKENKIKLSIKNHIKAHYYLWKIFFDNLDSKNAVQHLCKMENLENLTDEELNEIAEIEEECAKNNRTYDEKREYCKNWREENKEELAQKKKQYREEHKEELKEYFKNHYIDNKDEISKKQKIYYEENKEEISKKQKIYYEENKDEILNYQHEYYENNKDIILNRNKKYREDNKEKLFEYYKEYRKNNSESIKKSQKEWYDNNKEKVLEKNKKYREDNKEKIAEYRKNNSESIKKSQKEWYENNKEKVKKWQKEWHENNKDKLDEYRSQLCYDPIKKNKCKLYTLMMRQYRDKESYKDVVPTQCIIKN
jgi:hypothetical protein